MAMRLDHQLREQIFRKHTTFPITYFQDELAELPQFTGPLHWHPDFELASAEFSILEYQVGQQRIYWSQETVYLSTEMCCMVLSSWMEAKRNQCLISSFLAAQSHRKTASFSKIYQANRTV